MNKREFVNDEDTKELLRAVEQYARGRGIDSRIVLVYDTDYSARISSATDRGALDQREFEVEASHWYEVGK